MSHFTASLSEFRTNLRQRLGNDSFWGDDELDAAVRETLRTWNLLTGDWGRKVVLTTSNTSPWHILPTSITATIRVEYRGVNLRFTSLTDLDNGVPGWESVVGTPKYWAPAALNIIAIYPTPATSDDSVTVDGVCATPVPVGSDDIVDLDRAMFEVMLDYARHLLLFKLGGEEFEASKAVRKSFWEHAADDNRKITASAPYKKIMGAVLDHDKTPYRTGEKAVGIR